MVGSVEEMLRVGVWVVVGEGASLHRSSARNMLQPLHLCYSTRQRTGQLVFLLHAVAHVAAIGVDVPEKNTGFDVQRALLDLAAD